MKTNFKNGTLHCAVRHPRLKFNPQFRSILWVGMIVFLVVAATNLAFARGGRGGARYGGAGYGENRVESPGVGAPGAGVTPGVGAGARGAGVAPGAGVGAPGRGVLPHGYVYTVPAGYTDVYYEGYWCAYVNGVYYRPVYYEGSIVYVIYNPPPTSNTTTNAPSTTN